MQCKSLWIKASAKCINVKCKCKNSWTAPDLSVLTWSCYPALPPRHLHVLKHIWGGGGETQGYMLFDKLP